jgi:hypothetical protein
MAAIARLETPAPAAAAPLDLAQLKATLAELKRKLDDDDIAAGDLVEKVAGQGLAPPQLAALRELQKSIAGYDFDAARRALERLGTALDVRLETRVKRPG